MCNFLYSSSVYSEMLTTDLLIPGSNDQLCDVKPALCVLFILKFFLTNLISEQAANSGGSVKLTTFPLSKQRRPLCVFSHQQEVVILRFRPQILEDDLLHEALHQIPVLHDAVADGPLQPAGREGGGREGGRETHGFIQGTRNWPT